MMNSAMANIAHTRGVDASQDAYKQLKFWDYVKRLTVCQVDVGLASEKYDEAEDQERV